jgi:perosamine synthetase
MVKLAIFGGKPVFKKKIPINPSLSKSAINILKKSVTEGTLSNFEGTGFVQKFEEKFAKNNQTKYAICTNAGTSALHTALATLSLNNGDEVIIPAYTFIAGASIIIQESAAPVFADIDKKTYCIDPKSIESKITSKTKAIMPVHIYGHPADMQSIMRIAEKNNLVVIEDCAQAHGAKIGSKNVGTFGKAGCYSFSKTKNMTTGEGGIIVTNNKELAEESKIIRQNGKISWKEHKRLGYNYRMTDMQAALGISQLDDLKKMNKKRALNAKIYLKMLKTTGLILPKISEDITHAFYKLPIMLPEEFARKKDNFINALTKENLPIETCYSSTLNNISFLKKFSNENCPIAENFVKRAINLPVAPCLSKNTIKNICKGIIKVYDDIEYL